MPFTLCHPAAVIPFLRTRLIPSALVIGCMAPDFEYFIRRNGVSGYGHTLPGVFVFDLPMSLVVLWLFHVFAKEPLYSWFPVNVQQRIDTGRRAFPARTAAEFVLVLLSILIGTATHIFWDSFTHRGFWAYEHWQFLHRTIELPVYGPLEYLRVIQHLSTIFGAAVLTVWFRKWFRNTAPIHPATALDPRKTRYAVLLVVCLVALVAAIARGYLDNGIPMDVDTSKSFLINFVETAIAVFWLGVVLYGAFMGRFSGN